MSTAKNMGSVSNPLFEMYKINVRCDILLFVLSIVFPPKWVATYQLTTTGLEYQSKLPLLLLEITETAGVYTSYQVYMHFISTTNNPL